MSGNDERLRGPSGDLDTETLPGTSDRSNDACPQYCKCKYGYCIGCNRKYDENGLKIHFNNDEEIHGLPEFNFCGRSLDKDIFNWIFVIIIIFMMIIDLFGLNKIKTDGMINFSMSVIIIPCITILILKIISKLDYFRGSMGILRNSYFLIFIVIILLRIIIYSILMVLGDGWKKMKIG